MKIDDLDFKRICPVCAKCCYKGSPTFLPEERDKLIEKKGLCLNSFRDRGGVYELKGVSMDNPCPFLGYGRCDIEEAKPIECRIWPVYFIPMGEKVDLVVSANCLVVELGKLTPEFVEFARREIMKIPEKLRVRMYFIAKDAGFSLKRLSGA